MYSQSGVHLYVNIDLIFKCLNCNMKVWSGVNIAPPCINQTRYIGRPYHSSDICKSTSSKYECTGMKEKNDNSDSKVHKLA